MRCLDKLDNSIIMKYIECILLAVQYTDEYSFDSETGIDSDIDQLRSDSIDLYKSLITVDSMIILQCLLYFKVYIYMLYFIIIII